MHETNHNSVSNNSSNSTSSCSSNSGQKPLIIARDPKPKARATATKNIYSFHTDREKFIELKNAIIDYLGRHDVATISLPSNPDLFQGFATVLPKGCILKEAKMLGKSKC